MKFIQLDTDRELEVLLIALTGEIKGMEQIRLAGKCLDSLERIATLAYDKEGNIQIYTVKDGQIQIKDGQPVRQVSLKERPIKLELEDAHFNFLKARIFDASSWSGHAVATMYKLLQKFDEAESSK